MNATEITLWGFSVMAAASLIGGYYLHRTIAKADKEPALTDHKSERPSTASK